MVKLNKTPLLDKIKSHEDWRQHTPIRALLEKDCMGKCYICEEKPKDVSTLTVDHVVSRQYNAALTYNWDNLLLACHHCNQNVKGGKYNKIINPTVIDPECLFDFGMTYDLRNVDIETNASDEEVLETKQLLDEVYKNPMLTQKLSASIKKLIRFMPNAISGEDWALDYIRNEINRSSKFAAFKRKIIRDDPNLSEQLAEALT
ncbi:MAG: HNH endonuclease [Lachnospiraceae bacterium]|jgi:uncharacterized protein (TIGR02646 family)|nr:HNH endonuclease [Lachnospiraceae bacterium]